MADTGEFDVDEFLDSATAARIEELVTRAVHNGNKRTFWWVLGLQLIVAIVVVLLYAVAAVN